MPIQAACPACGVPLQLPDDAAGRSFQCMRCGTSLATTAGGQIVKQPLTQAAGSPFAPSSPFAPANPFADSPQGGYYGPGQFYPSFAPAMTREQALAKVSGPAVLLIVYGLLWLVAGFAVPLLLLTPEAKDDEAILLMVLIFAPICIGVGAFTMFSGWRMKRLRSYGLIMTCVVITIGLGILTCPMLAIVAVWPLAVLLDLNVKPHFLTPN